MTEIQRHQQALDRIMAEAEEIIVQRLTGFLRA